MTEHVIRTQVAVIGAGPAGLVLARLLQLRGIDAVVIENRSREYVEHRIRAGVLEHGTVDLLTEAGVADRLHREGMPHKGIELLFEGEGHRIAFDRLVGKDITVYGQHEVVKDLIADRVGAGLPLLFEVSEVDVDNEHAVVRFVHDGRSVRIDADFVAGCDGFHGVCRPSIPDGVLTVYERVYPFAWLGILAEAPPSSQELIYASTGRGFALHSMRSPTVTRNYLQVRPDENLDEWPDDRIWSELQARLARHGGFELTEGPLLEKSVTAMRSFVVEPMQFGKLFLAGDAAHIVPPTGAKGMNLAIADVKVLADALESFYTKGSEDGLAKYTQTCLRRVWRVQHFSWWMTSMLHLDRDGDPFTRQLQLSQLRYVATSRLQAASLAENYVGLPLP
jgi:p-hydroxybenzoate 3-monooxygenase